MEDKSIFIKRIVALALSCLMIIIALVLNATSTNDMIKIGRGEKVETLAEMNNLLEFYNSRNSDKSLQMIQPTFVKNMKNSDENKNLSGFSSSSFEEKSDDVSGGYSSFTLKQKSEGGTSSSFYSPYSSTKQSVSFSREYEMACTKTETLYTTKMSIRTYNSTRSRDISANDEENESLEIKILMDISIYVVEEKSYMWVRQFNISTEQTGDDNAEEESYLKINEFYNELIPLGWIDISNVPGMKDILSSLDQGNINVVDWMSSIINSYESDKGVFEQRGKVFVVSEENLLALLQLIGVGTLLEEDKFNAKFEFDLTNEREPRYNLSLDFQRFGSENKTAISSQTSESGTFVGINATKLKVKVSNPPSIMDLIEKYKDIF